MKTYTKTGDGGETDLLGGKRVSKTHPCVEVCGTLDELNSWVGVLRNQLQHDSIESGLQQIQNDLFCVGATVAGCLGETKKEARVGESRVGELEVWMDELDETLPPLTAFVLPGGTALASWMHLARNVCRRAERQLVGLTEDKTVVKDLKLELIFLNRLSDLMFLLARKLNAISDHPETTWQPG